MKENDIIKALHCCAANACISCPLCKEDTIDDCTSLLSKNCINLINKKNEEIEQAKDKAIKEFTKKIIALWK